MSSGDDVFLKLSQVDSHIPVKFFDAPHLLILLIKHGRTQPPQDYQEDTWCKRACVLDGLSIAILCACPKIDQQLNFARKRHSSPVHAMSLQAYLAFVAACIALALLPGPIVTLVIANGLRHGTRAALINIAGAQAGLAIVIGIVAVGLTSLMATMGYWFDWVRFAGAACLGWVRIE